MLVTFPRFSSTPGGMRLKQLQTRTIEQERQYLQHLRQLRYQKPIAHILFENRESPLQRKLGVLLAMAHLQTTEAQHAFLHRLAEHPISRDHDQLYAEARKRVQLNEAGTTAEFHFPPPIENILTGGDKPGHGSYQRTLGCLIGLTYLLHTGSRRFQPDVRHQYMFMKQMASEHEYLQSQLMSDFGDAFKQAFDALPTSGDGGNDAACQSFRDEVVTALPVDLQHQFQPS